MLLEQAVDGFEAQRLGERLDVQSQLPNLVPGNEVEIDQNTKISLDRLFRRPRFRLLRHAGSRYVCLCYTDGPFGTSGQISWTRQRNPCVRHASPSWRSRTRLDFVIYQSSHADSGVGWESRRALTTVEANETASRSSLSSGLAPVALRPSQAIVVAQRVTFISGAEQAAVLQ